MQTRMDDIGIVGQCLHTLTYFIFPLFHPKKIVHYLVKLVGLHHHVIRLRSQHTLKRGQGAEDTVCGLADSNSEIQWLVAVSCRAAILA